MKRAKAPGRLPAVLRRLTTRAYAAIRLRPLSRLARACRKGLRVDWV